MLAATCELIVASAAMNRSLSRSRRIALAGALLRLGEADRAVALALASPDERRLGEAAAELGRARATLVDAGRDAAFDIARRRSISAA